MKKPHKQRLSVCIASGEALAPALSDKRVLSHLIQVAAVARLREVPMAIVSAIYGFPSIGKQ